MEAYEIKSITLHMPISNIYSTLIKTMLSKLYQLILSPIMNLLNNSSTIELCFDILCEY